MSTNRLVSTSGSPGGSHNPLLDSGLALSGANQGLLGKTDPEREDGVLYSLEALGLNLQGTELVALSACETRRGAVDYSEGVYGLVRSLLVADATSVLMTLYPVDDGQARDFMIAFYQRWLAQRQSEPAAALRETKLAYLRGLDPKLRDPKVWAPYVLVGLAGNIYAVISPAPLLPGNSLPARAPPRSPARSFDRFQTA